MTFSPSRFTPPLSEDFSADIDRFLPALEYAWRSSLGYWLDDWQIELVRRITELGPDGFLRWRSCLVSVSRQAGKTELVSVLGVWCLLRKSDQFNLGVASNVDQARICYERIQRIIQATPGLRDYMHKLTDTRGIRTKDNSRYEIKAAKANTLQGYPVSVAIIDEVHLVDESVFSALVAGQGARKDSIIIGITTAGDQDSALLKNLYDQADKAIADGADTFGAWIWEASEAVVPDDDSRLLELLAEANPALQCGRIDGDVLIKDVRMLPTEDIIRYRLNRFVHSNAHQFIPLSMWWNSSRNETDYKWPGGKLFFSIDRTSDGDWTTVAVAVLDGDTVHTEIVAHLYRATNRQLVDVAQSLMSHTPVAIVLDGWMMKELAHELSSRGFPLEVLTRGDQMRAASRFYELLIQNRLVHDHNVELTFQIPNVKRRNSGQNFYLSKDETGGDIEAVIATCFVVWAASEYSGRTDGLQLFVS